MTWIADPEQRRTFDPEAGLELFFLSSGSDGSSQILIKGEGVEIQFTGSMEECPLTESEQRDLGIDDGSVWFVWGGDRVSEDKKRIIYEALQATQWAHGFNPRGNPVFVRFGRGALFDVESPNGRAKKNRLRGVLGLSIWKKWWTH